MFFCCLQSRDSRRPCPVYTCHLLTSTHFCWLACLLTWLRSKNITGLKICSRQLIISCRSQLVSSTRPLKPHLSAGAPAGAPSVSHISSRRAVSFRGSSALRFKIPLGILNFSTRSAPLHTSPRVLVKPTC